MSNVFKHALSEEKNVKISIDFKKDKTGNYTLTVKDNGTGLPDNFDIRRKTSLGYQLVNALVGQLEGKLKISGEEGTNVTITFPE